MLSAPRGLAPREGLGFVLVKMGRAGPPFEPRRRPQAGKSGDPRSQNTDIHLVTYKHEVQEVFKRFSSRASTNFGVKIKHIRSDNGTEFSEYLMRT